MNPRPRLLYGVLNMGLGHASRSLPVIRYFCQQGWEVLVASSGRALAFLRQELPGVTFLEKPDYQLTYARRGILLPLYLLVQLPRFFSRLSEERQFCRTCVARLQPDAILSDHCYGMVHPSVPSFFLAHQLQFALPMPGNRFIGVGFFWHRAGLKKFRALLVPDWPDKEKGGMLSGLLSEPATELSRAHFVGWLSSVHREEAAPQIDALISISGPEPQRTCFARRVLDQLPSYRRGKLVVALGTPEARQYHRIGDLHRVYGHLSRRQYQYWLNRARVVVTRPGYSTLMELGYLSKPALLIPTPGQTEQAYLAHRLAAQGHALVRSQGKFDLVRDIPLAGNATPLQVPSERPFPAELIFQIVVQQLARPEIVSHISCSASGT